MPRTSSRAILTTASAGPFLPTKKQRRSRGERPWLSCRDGGNAFRHRRAGGVWALMPVTISCDEVLAASAVPADQGGAHARNEAEGFLSRPAGEWTCARQQREGRGQSRRSVLGNCAQGKGPTRRHHCQDRALRRLGMDPRRRCSRLAEDAQEPTR